MHCKILKDDEMSTKLESFINEKASQINISQIENQGLSLHVTDIHFEYQRLLESLLENFITTKCSCSIDEFYNQLKTNVAANDDDDDVIDGTVVSAL